MLASETIAPALADLVLLIREEHRHRQDYAGAAQRLFQQVGAIHRRFDGVAAGAPKGRVDDDTPWKKAQASPAAELATIHLEEARASLAVHQRRHERRMAELARQLPVWPWVEAVRGVGPLGLAQLVGECGDIGAFRGPAALWKRMGVGMVESCTACGAILQGHHGGICPACGAASIDRERQRRVTGERALAHGYSPSRRAVLYNLGEALVKQNQEGPYRSLYLARKAYEATKAACRMPLRSGGVCQSEDGTTCRPAHLHARARRVMEKAFLRDLYVEWRRVSAKGGA